MGEKTMSTESPLKWYQRAFRRVVIDMHLSAWDETFLSEFDAHNYVEMLKLAHAQSAVVTAHSCVGYFSYPTKVGEIHPCLKGRNLFGEVLDLCHQNDIKVVAICVLIFDRWAYDHHPEWRIVVEDGHEVRNHLGFGLVKNPRHGLCCPNAPGYRAYIQAMAAEIPTKFDVDGIRFDMTLWPAVCYCQHCQKRYADEVGGELPRIVNWKDPEWIRFQHKREEWLLDFAEIATVAARKAREGISVEHQSSTYLFDWSVGVTHHLAKYSDFLQGDFYGDALQGSVVRKLLYNLTENLPYGFETSFCERIEDHTNFKSRELLSVKAHAAIASGGAMIYIDALDPLGTLNRATYERVRDIFEEIQPYEGYLGGEFCQDVGVYLSTISKFNPDDNGKHANDPHLSSESPHLKAFWAICQTLISNHIPFGVITQKDLPRLSQHRLILLPDVLLMEEFEAEAFRTYVSNGGNLYASKYTSVTKADGSQGNDFLLADLFGVSLRGETHEDYTYVQPVTDHENLFPGYSQKYPYGLSSTQMMVAPAAGTEILAKIVLPYTNPQDSDQFVLIHSNPPGVETEYPALTFSHFGKGKVIYAAGTLETAVNQNFLKKIIDLFDLSFSFKAQAPGCVEVTLFHQSDQRRYLVNLLNFQKDLPNIPVTGIKVWIKLMDKKPVRVIALPQEQPLPFVVEGDYVQVKIPQVETLYMLALDY
jgi:hypothetical protein